MDRPKLFLDTNICINAANGTIPADEWLRFCRHINARYRYRISFITLKELFSGLARGKDEFFEKNKEALHVLNKPTRCKFLAYPPIFAVRTVLGFDVSRRFPKEYAPTEEKFAELIYKIALQASSKSQLKTLGVRDRYGSGQMLRFDLDHFDSHENHPQNENVNSFQRIRDGKIQKPDPITMAKLMLEDVHAPPTNTGEHEKLAQSLDAAFRHICKVGELAETQKYKILKYANNWGDQMQLYYLCDESMHFLTCEKRFIDYTKGSYQQSRILLYKDFVQSL